MPKIKTYILSYTDSIGFTKRSFTSKNEAINHARYIKFYMKHSDVRVYRKHDYGNGRFSYKLIFS